MYVWIIQTFHKVQVQSSFYLFSFFSTNLLDHILKVNTFYSIKLKWHSFNNYVVPIKNGEMGKFYDI